MLRFLALCLMFSSLTAQAGLREGMDAYKSGDYTTALKEFSVLAEQNDALGQYGLGLMYATGKGVARDEKKAAELMHKAAEQGDAGAQDFLGVMYAKGQGVAQDYAQALHWFNKAAEQHEPGALYTLGLMYSTGKGVTLDIVEACKWLILAEQAGNRLAGKSRAAMERKLTFDQREETIKRVRVWQEAHR